MSVIWNRSCLQCNNTWNRGSRNLLFEVRWNAADFNVNFDRIDLPQGTLDLLILRTLSLGAQHGWAISERVQQISSDVLQIQQGSLYPALQRLERRGWIRAKWGTSDNNRRAKYYDLTAAGKKQLAVETDSWLKLTAAVTQILESI
jgi:PadR family transcriptional regulator PadR